MTIYTASRVCFCSLSIEQTLIGNAVISKNAKYLLKVQCQKVNIKHGPYLFNWTILVTMNRKDRWSIVIVPDSWFCPQTILCTSWHSNYSLTCFVFQHQIYFSNTCMSTGDCHLTLGVKEYTLLPSTSIKRIVMCFA